ncbi:MAG: fasciclin domain-containing protein [Bacteroidota bacterium]|nr:fasciclin domain-containing protein [Bacteroidota bacterium]
MSNITQTVNTDKNLKTIKKGIHASDLDQLLSSSGPYTLFAPSDLAFEKLAKGTMDNLLEPQNRAKLADLVNNHIVAGKILYSSLKDGDKLTTVNGKELLVGVKDGAVKVDGINVQPRDAKISNGVLHQTDTVIV